MWLPRSLLCLLAFAILPLVSAQSSNSTQPSSATSGGSSAPAASAQITVITSVSTSVGIGASRVETTAISTFLITSTIQPTSASTEPSPTSSPASSTTTANLPTGTASLVTDQAPSPVRALSVQFAHLTLIHREQPAVHTAQTMATSTPHIHSLGTCCSWVPVWSWVDFWPYRPGFFSPWTLIESYDI
ncbi:hypothetical protein DFH07DRAFT_205792 [Mycena maculata]|uniref:Uncharacterized protein n=1 Tax=Mycena maculata TaxID=230809 RepID=A0AAD7KE89_9AGAR|nr:hypothetical protein DFH07DRAFT_205792 [Mycena maculata]